MPINRLPVRLRPQAVRIRRWALTDGPLLVLVGLAVLARGISYLPSVYDGDSQHPAEGLIPLDWWAMVWVVIGTFSVVMGLMPTLQRANAVAVGLCVGLHLLWASSFMLVSATGERPRGWVSAVSYALIAALMVWAVWRGQRRLTLTKE
ncbi:hypothetical protein QPX10_10170 [Corynebacterium pseudodiphtheriticum]|uniref:hypothetical protein n=1 Tax=Corynebacterium pseudodiphtheriticum TaxID=37637 RepID=UPI002543A1D9|nr:hypothetical protein [Corynebacterium pseudodiphtheriticum]MDK4244032.1 hypothetical protein [Corynebacterium pseudodiphtheriticum]MDK4329179.1 hypothetical protein [Corynebacterium pseudodiphtheriticum]